MARKIVRGFLSIFGGRVAIFGITFIGTPILVRVLGGSAPYGDYKFLMSGFALLMIVISSGVSDGVQKFVSESNRYRHWKDHVVAFYVRTAFALAAIGAVAVAAASFSGIITRTFGPGYEVYLLVIAVLVITAQFRELSTRILRGLGEEQYSEPLRVLDAAVWGLGGILLAWIGLDVTGVLIAHVLGGLLVSIIGFALIARRVKLRQALSRTPNRLPVRQLMSFNVLSIVLVLFMTSLYKIDIIMIRTFLTDDLTGQYAAALALAEHLWFVPLAIQSMFVHSSSSLWSEHRIDQINDLASKTTRYTVLFTALLALGIAALAGRFIPIYYGPGFENAVLPLILLLPGAVALAVVRPIYAIGKGSGELRPLVLATGFAAVINAILNFMLIPRYGIVGAAVSTSIGYGLMLPLHIVTARHIGFNPLNDLRPVRILVTTAAAAIPIFALSQAIDGMLAFFVVPPFGALAFGLVAIATRAVTAAELLDVLGHFPDPVGRVARHLRGRLEGRSSPASLPNILTAIGILLLVGGIVLSLSGAIGPGGPGGIGGSATNETTTTTEQEAEDPTNPDDTQQAGTEDETTTTTDDAAGTTDDPDTTTAETTTAEETTTTEDPTTTEETTTSTAEETTTTTTEDPTTTTTTEDSTTTTTTEETTTTTTTTTTTEDPTTTTTSTTEETTTTTTTEETTTTTTTTEEPTTTTTTTTTTTEDDDSFNSTEETSTTTTTTEETTNTTTTTTTTTEDDDSFDSTDWSGGWFGFSGWQWAGWGEP